MEWNQSAETGTEFEMLGGGRKIQAVANSAKEIPL